MLTNCSQPAHPRLHKHPGVPRHTAAPTEYEATGAASWYGPGFHRRRTASGARFNMHALTCAHRTLPFGTKLRVTHARTGQSVVVVVNDRGPHTKNRIVDLSKAAAKKIGMLGSGTASVAIRVMQ